MKFKTSKKQLIKPLQSVMGVVERKQSMPILSNVLLSVSGDNLTITATDLEVELRTSLAINDASDGQTTVPGRKFYDICRALPEDSDIELVLEKDKLIVKTKRSKFTLSILDAADFPLIEEMDSKQAISIDSGEFKDVLLEKTMFSMAQQDVRFYLNGLLLEVCPDSLRAVATDGHRLAVSELALSEKNYENQKVIIPRKGVLELHKILDNEEKIDLEVGKNHIRVSFKNLRFTSKLIDGQFPDYQKVIPSDANNILVSSRDTLKDALQRVAILSNEKYRGVRLNLSSGLLRIEANNPDQEEAEETIKLKYEGEDTEIGFNVNYLLEALGAVDEDGVEVSLGDSNSSCLIRAEGNKNYKFVVMPMRL